MAISIKQLTINTKVNKKQASSSSGKTPKAKSGGVSKMEAEAIIEECIRRMRDIIEYENRP